MKIPKFHHSAPLVEALKTISNVEDLENKDGFLFVTDSDPDQVASDQVQRSAELTRLAIQYGVDIYYGAYESKTVEGLYGFVYIAATTDTGAVKEIQRRVKEARKSSMKVSDHPVLAAIQNILWPGGDGDHEWDSETIARIAQVVDDAGLSPRS